MLRDKILITFFGLSGLVIVGAVLIALIGLPAGVNSLILRFTAGTGVDYLGGRAEIITALCIVFAVAIINAVLAREIYYRERFLSYLIAVITFIISVFSLIAVGVIVHIN